VLHESACELQNDPNPVIHVHIHGDRVTSVASWCPPRVNIHFIVYMWENHYVSYSIIRTDCDVLEGSKNDLNDSFVNL
jgi:hypothetical protein